MASLRRGYLDEVLARVETIDDVHAIHRGAELGNSTEPFLAVVFPLSEDKEPTDTLFYTCTFRVGVLLRLHSEDADPTEDDGNAFLMLERRIADVERVVHAAPWANEAIVNLLGWDMTPPNNENVVEARVTLSIEYRHNLDDPDTYDPHYTDA